MTIFAIQIQLTVDGKPVPGIWETEFLYSTKQGAEKALYSIQQQLSLVALGYVKNVRIKEMELFEK